jgi:hypothetical protein
LIDTSSNSTPYYYVYYFNTGFTENDLLKLVVENTTLPTPTNTETQTPTPTETPTSTPTPTPTEPVFLAQENYFTIQQEDGFNIFVT